MYVKPMSKRGFFILFEGCDGTGKTTQSRLLSESGILTPNKQMVFPDRTTAIGQIIDQYLKKTADLSDQAIHLLYSANRWEVSDKMKKLLESGTSIICDRYWYSGTAYSAAKGMSIDWCKQPDVGIPEPDLVIFLDADPKILLSRRGFGEERYEKVEFQQKVRDVFYQLKNEKWVIVDATKPIEEVTAEVQKTVKEFVESH
ncbi:Thymidylate kinase [Tritrichomonas foetus]|uniref:Thymidylate kinase n=1 Tax=Tritrichomonas foetus TaxID=1144522 RepID=A0A1J4K6X6_9EUKA|nr:Thymidylate kinase [Tritrichomonas foetus]|eukprot:OHT05470.1 Thymidylate kinase [Tritrichomonas foetus]